MSLCGRVLNEPTSALREAHADARGVWDGTSYSRRAPCAQRPWPRTTIRSRGVVARSLRQPGENGVVIAAAIPLGCRASRAGGGALDNRPRRLGPRHSNRRAAFFLVPDAVFQSGLKHGPAGEDVHTFHRVPTPPNSLSVSASPERLPRRAGLGCP